MVYFGGYEMTKQVVGSLGGQRSDAKATFATGLVAGFVADFFSLVVYTPSEVRSESLTRARRLQMTTDEPFPAFVGSLRSVHVCLVSWL